MFPDIGLNGLFCSLIMVTGAIQFSGNPLPYASDPHCYRQDFHRIQRVLVTDKAIDGTELVGNGSNLATHLEAEHARLRALTADQDTLASLTPSGTMNEPAWYLVDPAGWVMMRYPNDLNYSGHYRSKIPSQELGWLITHGFNDVSMGDFLELTKPRVVALMLITAIIGMCGRAGFYAVGAFSPGQFGDTLCAGAAAVLITWSTSGSIKMSRTTNRPVAQGRVTKRLSFLPSS